jgi:hypothetical protein
MLGLQAKFARVEHLQLTLGEDLRAPGRLERTRFAESEQHDLPLAEPSFDPAALANFWQVDAVNDDSNPFA